MRENKHEECVFVFKWMHCFSPGFGCCERSPSLHEKRGFEVSEGTSSPLSQKSKWGTEPFTWSGFLSSFFCRNVGILQCLCLAGSSAHPTYLTLLEPSLSATTQNFQVLKDVKWAQKPLLAASNSLTHLYPPGYQQQLEQGLDWALLSWHRGRSQRAKRNPEPSWEGRFLPVSPLPSRDFHPPCG